MSNPLLRPDDPRFQPRQVQQPDGTNPFSEGEALLDAAAASQERRDNVFAPPADDGGRPFVPHYELTADHRGGLLLALSSIGIIASLTGWLVIGGVMSVGWLFPLLGVVPAFTVVFMAYEDLKMMRLGGRDSAGRGLTRTALIISASSLVLLLTAIGLLIHWGVNWLPEGM